MFIQDTAIVIIEEWTDYSGIQAYKEKVRIKELKTSKTVFDATEQEITISFKIDDYSTGARVIIEDREWNFTGLTPDVEYKVIWDGRHNNGNLFLPGNYIVRLNLNEGDVKTISVKVKGTIKSGTLSPNEHWTEEGGPYVLTGDVQLAYNGRLEIDPGVKVMPTGNYGIKLPYSVYKNSLIVQGTVINKILFTPHRKLLPEPDTIPRGFWKGIGFEGYYYYSPYDDTLMLEHCIIEAAGSDTAAIHVKDWGQVIMDNCEIRKSGGYGYYETHIRAGRNYPMTCITNCSFKNNDSLPIRVSFSSICEIHNNFFENNNPQALEVIAAQRKRSGTIANQGIPYWFIARRYAGADVRFYVQSGTNDSCTTLTIEPGTKLFFEDSTVLIVGSSSNRGKVIAQGNGTDSIVIAARDTTLGWQGIHIASYNITDTSRFEYCKIEYGGQKVWGWAYGEAGALMAIMHMPLVVKNSLISYSKRMGLDLYLSYPYGDLSTSSIIEGNTFLNNDSFHLRMPANDLRNLKNNLFLNEDARNNGIYVIGERINKSFSLDYQGAPFIIASGITIGQSGDTVVVVELNKDNCLKFMKNTQLLIGSNGGLKAKGVTFTRFDTLSWYGIHFYNAISESCYLDSCAVSGQSDIYGGIYIYNGSPMIRNCKITNNKCGIALGHYAWNANPIIEGNLISLNECGIYNTYYGSHLLSLYNNEIYGNKIAIKNECNTLPIVDADSNWWGDETGPWDPSSGAPDYNPSGRGDSIGDYVIYRPWLTEPVQPQVVTLLQPNGGETLYCGSNYEIKWTFQMPKSPKYLNYLNEDGDEFQMANYKCQMNNKVKMSNNQCSGLIHQTNNETLKDKIQNGIASPSARNDIVPFCHPEFISGSNEMLKQVQHDRNGEAIGGSSGQLEAEKSKAIGGNKGQLDAVSEEGSKGLKGAKGQILRQELYWTTDFPEGGKAEAFWRFIDTVPVGETTYTWQVPNIPSNRCRVAIKIYYETVRQGNGEAIQMPKSPKYLNYLNEWKKAIGGNLGQLEAIGDKLQIPNPKFQTNSNIQIPNKIRDEMLNQIQHDIADKNKNLSSNFSLLTCDGCAIGVDISDGNWTIIDTISPAVTIIKPNGREYFVPTRQETIRWEASDNHKLKDYDVYLSTDGGVNFTPLVSNITQKFHIWTPQEYNCYNARIKVVARDSSLNTNFDISDNDFYLPIISQSSEMTAHNNGRRLLRDKFGRIHLVFTTETIQPLKRPMKQVEGMVQGDRGGAAIGGNLGQLGAINGDKSQIPNPKFQTNPNSQIINNNGTEVPTLEEMTAGNVVSLRSQYRYTRSIAGEYEGRGANTIYYTYSTDLGKHWQTPVFIGNGQLPSMAMNGDGTKIGITFVSNNYDSVLYAYYDGTNWNVSTLIQPYPTPHPTVYSPPSISWYADTDTVVVGLKKGIVFEYGGIYQEVRNEIAIIKFPYDSPFDTTYEVIDWWAIRKPGEVTFPRSVALACDFNNFPYLAYERPPGDTFLPEPVPLDIYYARKIYGEWYKENISNSTLSSSINPAIDCYGGNVYIVWQEQVDGYDIFLGKIGYTSGAVSRPDIDTISQTTVQSQYPVIRRGIILWSEGDTAEVYGRIWNPLSNSWLPAENWSNTIYPSLYPQIDLWQNVNVVYMFGGWTEVDTPWNWFGERINQVMVRERSFPSYYLQLGESLSTPFTQYRDSIATYNSDDFDLGLDSLVYYLPYIDKEAKCRLVVELYRPDGIKGIRLSGNQDIRIKSQIPNPKFQTNSNIQIPNKIRDEILKSETLNLMQGRVRHDISGQDGGDKWRIKLDVDGILHRMINLSPGELSVLDISVPAAVNHDGKVRIKFDNKKGDFILLRRILWFEYEREEITEDETFGSGPQGEEALRTAICELRLLPIYPNPAKGILRIRFNAPDEREITIKLYDVLGRLVHKQNLLKSKGGMNEVLIREKLPSGVYFVQVESDNFKEVKKAVVVR